jgi:hypothetical protein
MCTSSIAMYDTILPWQETFLIVVNVVLGSFVVHGSSSIHHDDTALVEKF